MTAPTRLLLVEDSISDAELVMRQLHKDGFDLIAERVEDEASMSWMLENRDWDLIVSDYRLPQFSAPKALALVQQAGTDIPFIVLSGAVGEHAAVEIMRNGAHDFIGKDKLWQLGPAIQRELRESTARSDHRQAVRLLRTSERHYRSLVENISQGFYICDRRSIFTYVNAAISAVSGYSEVELIGTSAFRLVHPEDRSRVTENYLQWANSEVMDTRIEFRLQFKDGREMWVEQFTHYVRDPDSRLIKFRNFISDISERRKRRCAIARSAIAP